MAFRDFAYPDVLTDLGLTQTSASDLFAHVPPVTPELKTVGTLSSGLKLALSINTEKARSEWLIAPLLADVWDRYGARIGLYSGVEFNPDPAAKLNGFCDFLLGTAPQLPQMAAPLVTVVEAKNDNLLSGLAQCIAGMVGIQRFNRRAGQSGETAFGCVTTGANWRFLRLTGTVVTIDLTEYGLSQVDKLIGIFVAMLGPVDPLDHPARP